jgi:hypothetical protein
MRSHRNDEAYCRHLGHLRRFAGVLSRRSVWAGTSHVRFIVINNAKRDNENGLADPVERLQVSLVGGTRD